MKKINGKVDATSLPYIYNIYIYIYPTPPYKKDGDTK